MRTSRGVVVVTATVLFVAVAPGAQAQGPPKPSASDPAIAVYVEQIPTAAGSDAVNQVGGGGSTLPKPLDHKIRRFGGSAAPALEAIAKLGRAAAVANATSKTHSGAPRAVAAARGTTHGNVFGGQLRLLLIIVGVTFLLLLARKHSKPSSARSGVRLPERS
jgi:hypothetical protein